MPGCILVVVARQSERPELDERASPRPPRLARAARDSGRGTTAAALPRRQLKAKGRRRLQAPLLDQVPFVQDSTKPNRERGSTSRRSGACTRRTRGTKTCRDCWIGCPLARLRGGRGDGGAAQGEPVDGGLKGEEGEEWFFLFFQAFVFFFFFLSPLRHTFFPLSALPPPPPPSIPLPVFSFLLFPFFLFLNERYMRGGGAKKM